ncbi:MAG: DNA double-strand break repair nuclease NurA [Pyrobaculum sp.]
MSRKRDTRKRLTSSSKQMRILDFIADTGIVSYRDVAKAMGEKENVVKATLHRLSESGVLAKWGPGAYGPTKRLSEIILPNLVETTAQLANYSEMRKLLEALSDKVVVGELRPLSTSYRVGAVFGDATDTISKHRGFVERVGDGLVQMQFNVRVIGYAYVTVGFQISGDNVAVVKQPDYVEKSPHEGDIEILQLIMANSKFTNLPLQLGDEYDEKTVEKIVEKIEDYANMGRELYLLISGYKIASDLETLTQAEIAVNVQNEAMDLKAVFIDGSILPGHLDPYLDFIIRNPKDVPKEWIQYFIEVRNLLIESYCKVYERALKRGIWLIGVVKNSMDKTILNELIKRVRGVKLPYVSDQLLMKYMLKEGEYVVYVPHKAVGSHNSDLKDGIAKFCGRQYPIYNVVFAHPYFHMYKPMVFTLLAPVDGSDLNTVAAEVAPLLKLAERLVAEDLYHERVADDTPVTLTYLKYIDDRIRREKGVVADIIAKQLDYILSQLLGRIVSKELVEISGAFSAFSFSPAGRKLVPKYDEDLITMLRKFANRLNEL